MLHEKQSRKCERRPAADFGAVAGLLQVPLLAVVFAPAATVDEKKSSKFMFGCSFVASFSFACRNLIIVCTTVAVKSKDTGAGVAIGWRPGQVTVE